MRKDDSVDILHTNILSYTRCVFNFKLQKVPSTNVLILAKLGVFGTF